MTPPTIAEWAGKKGIGLVGTGDFTHPMWLRELEANLEEAGEGVYKLKTEDRRLKTEVKFLLTSEVSCMYTHEGKGRRVHLLVYLPDINSVKKFNSELSAHGANLFSDGRPIMGLSLSQVAQIALEANEKALVIPAHVWTPWFGFYGHMSGYNSLKEAFGDMEKYIPAVETGLSSDPAMNWRIGELEGKQIVSFGDAHSPQKLGREATVFELPEVSYENIWKAMWSKSGVGRLKIDNEVGASRTEVRTSDINPQISYTIEFYPEEGKYHYTGHRKCNVVYSPNEARKKGMTCPVCGRSLTIGVMSRVEALATSEVETASEIDKFGVRWIKTAHRVVDYLSRRPYVMLVPLLEILAESLESGVASQKVLSVYDHLVNKFEGEFSLLLKTPINDINTEAGEKIAEAILKVRSGDIVIKPGYDGVFGKVAIWKEPSEEVTLDQETLF
ncbi:hypothetical protein A2863_01500 [Candidatus Woesebacteria bacterium RIFCSPHIGHO2_01_FULL_38_9b]|uniref:DNA helicase UvrD n=1 Tax=Candidatus Woesebacteria bacterium RIFCSPHIGHO2_01_FULL_38_9b TaxID=1802493 RepID=A0A1F7XZL9_9BACT|nr:MAG: hypothetical protein A2863_01500 [Candidatus Woesebacteria bacterium RIFCSPHIGHO2_01_FULL_38_9b]